METLSGTVWNELGNIETVETEAWEEELKLYFYSSFRF